MALILYKRRGPAKYRTLTSRGRSFTIFTLNVTTTYRAIRLLRCGDSLIERCLNENGFFEKWIYRNTDFNYFIDIARRDGTGINYVLSFDSVDDPDKLYCIAVGMLAGNSESCSRQESSLPIIGTSYLALL